MQQWFRTYDDCVVILLPQCANVVKWHSDDVVVATVLLREETTLVHKQVLGRVNRHLCPEFMPTNVSITWVLN